MLSLSKASLDSHDASDKNMTFIFSYLKSKEKNNQQSDYVENSKNRRRCQNIQCFMRIPITFNQTLFVGLGARRKTRHLSHSPKFPSNENFEPRNFLKGR